MKKYWELFFSFFKIGILTIGGGMAMLPLVHNTVVYKKKWMTEKEMVDCLAIAQSLPGPVILNTATYVGRKRSRFLGSVCTCLGVVLPSFICIILIINVLDFVGNNPYLEKFFKGALAAAAGMVVLSCIKLGRAVFKDWVDIVLAVIVFGLVIFLQVNVVWIIVGSIFVGFILFQIRKKIHLRKRGKS